MTVKIESASMRLCRKCKGRLTSSDLAWGWCAKCEESLDTTLYAKINYLLEFMDKRGYLPDHSFTFPDGEIWKVED